MCNACYVMYATKGSLETRPQRSDRRSIVKTEDSAGMAEGRGADKAEGGGCGDAVEEGADGGGDKEDVEVGPDVQDGDGGGDEQRV